MTRSECYRRLREVLRHGPFALSLLDRLEEGEKFGETVFNLGVSADAAAAGLRACADAAARCSRSVNVHTVINVLDPEDIERRLGDSLRNKTVIQNAALNAYRMDCRVQPNWFLTPGSVWKNKYTFDLVRVTEINYGPEDTVQFIYVDLPRRSGVTRTHISFLRDFQFIGSDVYAALAENIYAIDTPRHVPVKHVALAERYHSGGYPGLRKGEVPAILSPGVSNLPRDFKFGEDRLYAEQKIEAGQKWEFRQSGRVYEIERVEFGLVYYRQVKSGARKFMGDHSFRRKFRFLEDAKPAVPIKVGSLWRHRSGRNVLVLDYGPSGVSFVLSSGTHSESSEEKFRRLCAHVADEQR